MGKSEIAQKIKNARLSAGLTQAQAAKKVGITYQAISNYERGINRIDSDTLVALCNAYGVAVSAIVTDNIEVVAEPAGSYPVDINHSAPIVGTVSAGPGLVAIEEIDGYFILPPNVKHPEEYRYFRVKGDSMEPDIKNGSMVLVHMQPDIENGELAVVIVNGEDGVVKRVQKQKDCLVLLSINPAYPPRVVMGQELAQTIIWGKVTYAWREF